MIYILFEDRKTTYHPTNANIDKDKALSELIDLSISYTDRRFILKRMKNENRLMPTGIMSRRFKYYFVKKYFLYVCDQDNQIKKITEELEDCPKTMKRLSILSSLSVKKKKTLKKIFKDNRMNISPYIYVTKIYYLRALYFYKLKLQNEEYNDCENVVLNDDTIVLQ